MTLSTISLHVSGDALSYDPYFWVAVDGSAINPTLPPGYTGSYQPEFYTVSASHSAGQWQDVTITGDFGAAGPSSVDVTFVNAAYSHLYVDYIDVNGHRFEGESANNGGLVSGTQGADPNAAVMEQTGTLAFDTAGSPPPASGGDAANDFTGNGTSDVLWHEGNGAVVLWDMSGGAAANTATVAAAGAVDPSWYVPATGDFNGDGTSDVLWRNDNGAVAIWQMHDGAIASNTTVAGVGGVDASWYVPATGDFNGDGKADIVWRNDNGAVAIWEMNGATVAGNTTVCGVGGVDASWHIAGTGDFNADGKADILWHNDNGAVVVWEMNGPSIAANVTVAGVGAVDPSWHIAGTGDFNGDGTSDILWRNDNGSAVIWQMQNGAIASNAAVTGGGGMDPSWHVAGTGDYNGDGKADILWHNDNGQNLLWTMDGSHVAGQQQLAATATDWHIA